MFRHGLQGEQPIVSEHLGSSIQQHYRQENVMTCHPMLSRDCPLAKLPMKRARSFTVVMPRPGEATSPANARQTAH
jgi:hypothetical protein